MNHALQAVFLIVPLLAALPALAAELPKGKTHTNSLGMRLVRVEPGNFLMGSAAGGDFDERPVHRVKIARPFYLGQCEVTNAQYERFDPPHRTLRGKQGFSREDDEAVVFVSWHDAARFCQWLATHEGLPYRLPTEAEWEYACRAGTTTAYWTGEKLSESAFHKNVGEHELPPPVPLTVGRTPANPWGLQDMHGNVEEWCIDWYGPYEAGDQADPVGRIDGDFRVTRGGSHSTKLEYLRSANRSGTLPEDRSWLIGFRVALGAMPDTKPLPVPPPPLHQQHVKQEVAADRQPGLDPSKPYFKGPRPYVKIPPGSEGPLFSKHNHDPAIVDCPNGDLLAIWYTCRSEPGRELGLAASRLRRGQEEWEPAAPFWDAPDRNDHAPALGRNGQTLYHFCGLSAAATWSNLALVLRTSTNSGATWSKAWLIAPEHGHRHQPVESVFRMREGFLLLPCDAVPGGRGGTAIHLSRDGTTWTDPGEGRPKPEFRAGATGAWIAGIHAGVVQLNDGRLLAFGRSDNIEGRMPQSVSADSGRTWTYRASCFPSIGGGQRLVVLRLAEGPIFFASFAKKMAIRDAAGKDREVSGLYAAVSFDEGETWPVRRLVTDDGPVRPVDGGGNTGPFLLGPTQAEPAGYLSVCQAADGLIHLISSKQHYAFNLTWLKTGMPPGREIRNPKHEIRNNAK